MNCPFARENGKRRGLASHAKDAAETVIRRARVQKKWPTCNNSTHVFRKEKEQREQQTNYTNTRDRPPITHKAREKQKNKTNTDCIMIQCRQPWSWRKIYCVITAGKAGTEQLHGNNNCFFNVLTAYFFTKLLWRSHFNCNFPNKLLTFIWLVHALTFKTIQPI